MKVLVVGSGGREHALCWKLAAEDDVQVVAAPGNPGMADVADVEPVAATDVQGLLSLASRRQIDLTIVGPEAPLAAGLVDVFTASGRAAFGPTAAAARLETSKAFAKGFMQRHGVPTARFLVCRTPGEARDALHRFACPVVLKADGLAAGKGVVVAGDRERASQAIEAAMVGRQFGAAGDTLVIEEYLEGHEASYFVLCDGVRGLAVGSAQDHKRAFDGDAGPNTGGMGAFAPAVVLDDDTRRLVDHTIVEPVLAGMAAEGTPFRGFLYVGLMLTGAGPKVVEFNVRFGDPEAQVVLPSIAAPLAPWLAAAAAGRLPAGEVPLDDDRFVGVVVASGGYPGSYDRGRHISGLDRAGALDGVLIFHAGTALRDGALVTDGGRVLTVVGRGADYREARERAYAAVEHVAFEGRHFRRDIALRALEHAWPPTPSSPSAVA
jgi:phosphoribosylamine--glycine ligase